MSVLPERFVHGFPSLASFCQIRALCLHRSSSNKEKLEQEGPSLLFGAIQRCIGAHVCCSVPSSSTPRYLRTSTCPISPTSMLQQKLELDDLFG